MTLPTAVDSRSHDPAADDIHRREFLAIRAVLDELLDRLTEAERLWSQWLSPVSPEYLASARNLVHYWAIRQDDLRDLQRRLAGYGLSSLGRSEPHVQATITLIRAAVSAMLEDGWHPPEDPVVGIEDGRDVLVRRADTLLGASPTQRRTRIMVTLPSEAATEPGLVDELVRVGMDIARINCAHDDADAWRAMARNVENAARSAGRTCKIAMDLGGPKLRTGPLQPGPRSVKLKPGKNAVGEVTAPVRAWLTAADEPAAAPDDDLTTIPVPGDWLQRRRPGDQVKLTDARGSKRALVVDNAAHAGGLIVSAYKTTYLVPGTTLKVGNDTAEVGQLPTVEQRLLLEAGDVLHLTRDTSPAPVDETEQWIGCTLPEVFEHVRVDDAVRFDDGKIGGTVVSTSADVLAVRIDQPAHAASKLKAGKGINLPDTDLDIPALTDTDIADLATVVELADMVQFSFVHTVADVEQLFDELDRLGADNLGIVLKIETRAAFEHLPQLVLTAMRRGNVGVMIARGDLAVEVGYERLAEVQEEILWLCESAHLPVIWATQVFEQLAKKGLPSRAEVSDAAMAERAECVMLNKGPYINEAVDAIDGILHRMARHHYKKTALLRTLHSWQPG